jgi:hypothetical protein
MYWRNYVNIAKAQTIIIQVAFILQFVITIQVVTLQSYHILVATVSSFHHIGCCSVKLSQYRLLQHRDITIQVVTELIHRNKYGILCCSSFLGLCILLRAALGNWYLARTKVERDINFPTLRLEKYIVSEGYYNIIYLLLYTFTFYSENEM